MISVEIDVSKIDNVGVKTHSGIMDYLGAGADRGYAEAFDRAPADRGELMRNMFSPTREKGAIKWGVRDTPYARPQEFGSDAHWAPIKPLKEWAGRVVGDESFGYYVQWKIAQEGTEANPYMRPGRAAQVRWYRSHDVSDEIDKELR